MEHFSPENVSIFWQHFVINRSMFTVSTIVYGSNNIILYYINEDWRGNLFRGIEYCKATSLREK